MVGGGRRSPPRHPSWRGGGRDGGGSDVRTRASARGRNAVDRGGSGAYVNSRGDSSERRFSLTGLERLADIEADGKRLVYTRAPGTGVASSIIAGGSQKVDAQKIQSSEVLGMDSNAEDSMAGDRELSMNDSSDLDEVLEILGGSEAEDFIRDVNKGARSLDLADQTWDAKGTGSLNGMAAAPDCAEMMDAEVKEELVYSEGVEEGEAVPEMRNAMAVETEHSDTVDRQVRPVGDLIDQVEVSRIIDNPMFESNRPLFTFGNGSFIRDLNKVSSDSNMQKIEVNSAGSLPKFTFGGMNTDDQVFRGKWGNADLCGSSKVAGSTSGVWGNDSSGNLASEQQLGKLSQSRLVKKEVDEIGKASNAWKKSPAVQLNLVEDVGSFLREDGLVDLNLNKAKENIQKLSRALVGSLLGRRLPFYVVQNELQRKWGHIGLTQINPLGSDCFLCWFENKDARDNVLLGGPWYVAGQIIGIDQWTPGLSTKFSRGFTSPVWVRLPNLPLEYWDEYNLARLAAGIGVPLFMDEQMKLWNRYAFARLCVRVDLSRRLPKGVWENGLNGRFFQPIEYEGIPIICLNCGKVGHK